MWLILLDASGSMADPFESATSFAGRQRTTLTQIKIDAAREALLLHLQSLGETTRTAIFAFRSNAELVYDGSTADTLKIKTILDGIVATNGTDIAAALGAVRNYADAQPNQPVFRVLLITDGLSEPKAAEAASRELLSRRIPVDVILIDPSEKGNELARRVIGGYGSVAAVTSASEMTAAVGEAGAAVRAEATAVEQAQASLQRATASLKADVAGEELSFTAAYPGELAKGSWASLLLFLHLSSLSEEARKRAMGLGQAKGSDTLTPSIRAAPRVPQGTEITLTPHLPGFDVNPASAPVTWQEDIQEFEFRIRPSRAPEGHVVGEVEVSVNGLPIARIPVSILIRPTKGPRPGDQEPKLSVGGVFLTVFASHSRVDADVIDICAKVYASLGVYLIIDREALIGGQSWRPAIRALIAGSDAFQLFWSETASVSPEVKEEILDALVIQGDRGTGFIRPTFWIEPPAPLPPELKYCNFTFLDLERVRNAHGKADAETRLRQDRDKPLKGAPDIPVAVLPLIPNIPAGVIHEIRQDVAFAVRFVEETVGERYYPVPTLLVDHHTVRMVRADETLDYSKFERERQKALTDWGHVLGSICFAFHMRRYWKDMPYETASKMAQRIGLDETAFDALRYWTEGSPKSWLVPRWQSLSVDLVPNLAEAVSILDVAVAVIAAALAVPRDPQELLRIHADDLDNSWAPWRTELAKLGLNCAGQSYYTELTGTVASFRAGLAYLRPYIERPLADMGDHFDKRPDLDEYLHPALHVADTICKGLLNDFSLGRQGLAEFVLSEIDPNRGWSGARSSLVKAGLPGILPNQTFPEFAAVFFHTIAQLLQQRIREAGDAHIEGYSIPTSAWKRLSASGIASGLHVSPDSKGDMLMSGPISVFVAALEGAWKLAEDLLTHRAGTGPTRFLMVDVPTYGIFAPASSTGVDAQLADKAREWSLPPALCLPSTDRVLLCAAALDDFRSVLSKTAHGTNLARLFLRSVLVHEHFHAFARTAPMDDGTPPPGPRYQNHWNNASSVNEAIAAWIQLYLARQEPELRKRILEYIGSGSYPQWPYAGAALIENAYQEKGLDEVRSLIRLLRTDPPLATAWMRESTTTHRPTVEPHSTGGKG